MTPDLDAIKARLARVAGKWPTKGVMAPGADEFGPKAWAAHGPLRCHATETGSARSWKQANADADFIAAAPADIAALVAEVSLLQQEARIQHAISDGLAAELEHLRVEVEAAIGEAATMRAWAEEAVKAENENAEYTRMERAAVVAWLRDNEDAWHMPTWQLADCIERGEHRREETK